MGWGKTTTTATLRKKIASKNDVNSSHGTTTTKTTFRCRRLKSIHPTHFFAFLADMRWKKEFESELPQTFDSIEIGMTGIIFRKKILLMAKSDASKKKCTNLWSVKEIYFPTLWFIKPCWTSLVAKILTQYHPYLIFVPSWEKPFAQFLISQLTSK